MPDASHNNRIQLGFRLSCDPRSSLKESHIFEFGSWFRNCFEKKLYHEAGVNYLLQTAVELHFPEVPSAAGTIPTIPFLTVLLTSLYSRER